MHSTQVFKAHNALELIKRVFCCLGGAQVITGGKRVAGINAHADAGFVLHAVDNRRQMFELKAEVAALTSGVLNHRRHAFGFIQSDVNGLGNARQAGMFVDLHQMAARMEVQQRQPQLFAALHFIQKRLAGFFQRFFNRVTEVDQVAVVGEDLAGPVAVFLTGGFEIINHLSGERCGAPLALIFGEQGESGRLNFGGANGGIRKATCSANVRSNIFHKGTPVNPKCL